MEDFRLIAFNAPVYLMMFGFGLLAFSVFRQSIAIYLAIAMTMIGLIVTTDIADGFSWLHAAAATVIVYAIARLFQCME